MSKTKVKARILKDAVVNYVSLVDNPASKIPFRLTKREQPPEGDYMFNLSNLSNKKKSSTPALLAIVCRKQDKTAMTALLTKHELITDNIDEQEGCILFKQEEFSSDGDVTAFEIAPNTVALVSNVKKNFSSFIDSTLFSENLQSTSFFPSFNMALDALFETTYNIMYKSADQDDAREMIKKASSEFSKYVVSLVSDLPEVVFKMSEPVNKNMMAKIKSVNALPYIAPVAKAKAKKSAASTQTTKGYRKKKKASVGSHKKRVVSKAQPTGKKKIAARKVTANDPRPAEDPASDIKDQSLTPQQQAAGQAAAEAVDNWEERDAAYNAAAAAVAANPKEYDKDGQLIEEEDPRDEDGSGYDPSTHDAHTGHTDEDDPYAGTTDDSDLAEADREESDPERFEESGATGDVKGNIGESFTDQSTVMTADGEVPVDGEEETLEAEGEDEVVDDPDAGSAEADGEGAGAGETEEETVQKGDQLAAISELLTTAMGPLVTEVQKLNARVDGVEEVANGAQASSKKIGKTVLGGDDEDTLTITGHTLRKTDSLWDGSGLDNIVGH